MTTSFHSIQCIVPPYILTKIAEEGTPAQRNWAAQTLIVSEQIRKERVEITSVTVPTPPAEAAIADRAAVFKDRAVYDAGHGGTLPGNKVRGEGDPATNDAAVDEAYDGAGATFDLYNQAYKRNSIDGLGLRIDSTVHYENRYDNAFWNGNQMVYGDGDESLPENERLFNRFTISIDVIGHELTHGVTQYTAQLTYSNQSGALNESISDVFGSLVKQHSLGQTAAQADWLIGQGLLTANVKGVALRSMKAPGTAYDDPVLGKDPQPAAMKDYNNTTSDNGGVHINSGIPNHAFYVVATQIGGNAWEKAGQIWYDTLKGKLHSSASFADAAALTFQTAGELYGVGSLEQQAVRTGWNEVGISVDSAVPQPTTAGCLPALFNLLQALSKSSSNQAKH